MKSNIGLIDKIIRIIIAAVIAFLFYTNILPHNWVGITLMIVAAVLLFTSLISWCGLYSLLGISTCKKK